MIRALQKNIKLNDSSTVVLEPFSSLKYPTFFSKDQRVVILKGEAFFDIQRDTMRPFLVYANETITKVLGTSFNINAYEGEETVEVEVISGKVAVYANVNAEEKLEKKKQILLETNEKILIPKPNKKLELTPNQKVVFNRSEKDMVKTLAAVPQVLSTLEKLPQIQFDNESVVNVFKALEQAYGIEFIYQEEALKNCPINTKLKEESLFETLNIICAALGLEFTEKNATIYITGEGC